MWLLVVVVVLLGFGWIAAPYVRSAAFVIDLSGTKTWVRRLMPVSMQEVKSRDLVIPTRGGTVKARFYQPASPSDRTLLVFPGIHNGDVDEPRLAAFSRRLAASGVNILSIPLPDLRVYRILPISTDVVEDTAVWAAADRTIAPTGRVGLVGVSFAGGLALVAAGRPSLQHIVQFQ